VYRIERKTNGIWSVIVETPGDYDAQQARHHAESLAETTGDVHRVISERQAVIFCSSCPNVVLTPKVLDETKTFE
jgi:hypothetical protein